MNYIKNGLVSKEKILDDLSRIEKRYEEDITRIYELRDELIDILERPPDVYIDGGLCFEKIIENDKDFLFNMKQRIITIPEIGRTKNREARSKLINATSVMELLKIYHEEEF
jgi:hypothetical protein